MSELDRGATYTYAVARLFDPTRIAGLLGVDGAPVRLIGHRNVVAVVSTAEPEGLDEVSLSARLERLDELEMIARSHDAVVASVCAHTVALPFRLATIHRSESSVVEMLRREYDELVARLDRLSGHVELGVKVYAGSASPASPPRGIADGRIGSSPTETSGRGYLQRRKEEQRSRDTAWQLSTAAAARADTELRKLAAASRHHRPHHGQLGPDRGDNVLNAAYLVELGLVDRFTIKVRDLDRELLGARVDVTGPWAPYSFVDDDDQ
jgi:Gas vesicle synthesis protein GvpL/GvpF